MLKQSHCRLRERENRKRRRQELREQGEDPGPSKKQLKKNTMANSACKIRVAIDCGFDHMMAEKVGQNRNRGRVINEQPEDEVFPIILVPVRCNNFSCCATFCEPFSREQAMAICTQTLLL